MREQLSGVRNGSAGERRMLLLRRYMYRQHQGGEKVEIYELISKTGNEQSFTHHTPSGQRLKGSVRADSERRDRTGDLSPSTARLVCHLPEGQHAGWASCTREALHTQLPTFFSLADATQSDDFVR